MLESLIVAGAVHVPWLFHLTREAIFYGIYAKCQIESVHVFFYQAAGLKNKMYYHNTELPQYAAFHMAINLWKWYKLEKM